MCEPWMSFFFVVFLAGLSHSCSFCHILLFIPPRLLPVLVQCVARFSFNPKKR